MFLAFCTLGNSKDRQYSFSQTGLPGIGKGGGLVGPVHQGLLGDGCDRAGACKRPQNDPWGVVNSARKKKLFYYIFFKIVF
jgi:hypothetical protein